MFEEFNSGKTISEINPQNSTSHPGEINYDHLLLDQKLFYHDFGTNNAYNNYILKDNVIQNEDYVVVSSHAWKFLARIYESIPCRRFQYQTRNGMEEIDLKLKRVSIYVGQASDHSS